MGKIAFAGITGERTAQRRINGGLTRCKRPRIIPQGFTHVRLVRHLRLQDRSGGNRSACLSMTPRASRRRDSLSASTKRAKKDLRGLFSTTVAVGARTPPKVTASIGSLPSRSEERRVGQVCNDR